MANGQLQTFEKRVARVERAYARGHGFEAAGTLGRSAYRQRRGWRIPVLMPLLFLLLTGITLKAAIAVQLGPDLYAQRIERLRAGSEVEKIGALILAPDPVSGAIADQIRRSF